MLREQERIFVIYYINLHALANVCTFVLFNCSPPTRLCGKGKHECLLQQMLSLNCSGNSLYLTSQNPITPKGF